MLISIPHSLILVRSVMTVEELIKIDAYKVRRDSNLMRLYVEMFKERFGYAPNCAGCSFSSDFAKLRNSVLGITTKTQSKNTMKNTTFIFKGKRHEIYSFRRGNAIVRRYGYNLSEEFVIGFLTHGTEAELRERRKLFSKLPDVLTESPNEETPIVEQPVVEGEPESNQVEETLQEPEKEEPAVEKPKAKRGRKKKSE